LSVFVLDKRQRPVMPCSERRANLPLECGRAVVHRRYPFTVRLNDRVAGEVGTLVGWQQPTLAIKASARGDDCQTKLTAHGFPRGYCMRSRSVRGFQTGDVARTGVPTGKQAGTHVGRVAVRGSGCFGVGNADAINAKCCKLLHRADGCCYARQPALPPRPEERGFQRGRL
jgi:RRXRR protein